MNEVLRETLLQMREDDLQTRRRLAETGELFDGYNAEMEAVHLKNAGYLEKLVEKHGWLGTSEVGEDGAEAAWLVALHAISLPDFMKRSLNLIEEAAKTGEVPPWQAAYLADRIAFFENRPQKCGTQSDWNESGEMEVWTLEDEEKVNEYRAQVGLKPLESRISEGREFTENAPKNPQERQREFENWARKVGWRK